MLRQLRTSSPDASADLAALLDRSTRMADGVDDAVAAILADVRARRDAAVAEYTRRFDKREPVGGRSGRPGAARRARVRRGADPRVPRPPARAGSRPDARRRAAGAPGHPAGA